MPLVLASTERPREDLTKGGMESGARNNGWKGIRSGLADVELAAADKQTEGTLEGLLGCIDHGIARGVGGLEVGERLEDGKDGATGGRKLEREEGITAQLCPMITAGADEDLHRPWPDQMTRAARGKAGEGAGTVRTRHQKEDDRRERRCWHSLWRPDLRPAASSE